MSTLAQYNNNPGNIRPAKGVKYEGLLGVDDKGFGIFATPEDGQKALVGDLTYKLGKRGIKTPSDFVDVYSPASEENTEESRDNYKIFIAQKLGLKSTGEPFPEDAVPQLAKAVTAFEGGTWNQKEKENPSVAVASLPPPPPKTEGKTEDETKAGWAPTEEGNRDLNPVLGAGVGAVAGAGAGAKAAQAQARLDAALKAYDFFSSKDGAPVAAAEAPPAQAAARPPQAAAPAPKHGGQNWVKALTDVDLPEAQMSKADLDTAKGMKVAVGRSGSPGFTGGTITKGGVIISPQTAAAMQPTPAQMAAENARLMREAKQRVASERVIAEMLANKNAPPISAQNKPLPAWMSYAKKLGAMPVMGGLAGASAGFGAVDAMNRLNKKDTTGATIGGLGTAAGLAAGFVPSMGALPAAGLAAPLYLTASDRIEYLKKHPEMIQLMEDEFDAMGNRQR
jgi:hypothetical protein